MSTENAFVFFLCLLVACFTVGYCWTVSNPSPPHECHEWARSGSSGIGATEFQELFETCMKERGMVVAP